MSPEISTSAAWSTLTSIVHLPFPPPPVIVARRDTEFPCAGWMNADKIAALRNIILFMMIAPLFISQSPLQTPQGLRSAACGLAPWGWGNIAA
jgi:hypothetical protein